MARGGQLVVGELARSGVALDQQDIQYVVHVVIVPGTAAVV
jgi:hypothetical protein